MLNYETHIDALLHQWREILEENHFDAALVEAGKNELYFEDDQEPPFHAFGHFLRWVPQSDCEHAVLLISLDDSPILFWYTPADFWYLPSSPPTFCQDKMKVRSFDSLERLHVDVKDSLTPFRHVAVFGEASVMRATSKDSNQRAWRQLDHLRAYKTPFEQGAMRRASRRGVEGHKAAKNAFFNHASELEISQAFLAASEQHHDALPYPSIVALNEHAATLHYQRYDRNLPYSGAQSLLIDAGAKDCSYHADITRTYANCDADEFEALISTLDAAQQSLIESIKIGGEYLALHEQMHQRTAEILVEFKFVNCSAEVAYEQQVTDTFFPHGLGHLLGLQTHDVGGKIPNGDGIEIPPHERYDSLRILRKIEQDMVFTIEPGIYFIPTLLNDWRGHSLLNWDRIDQFKKYGGVRIEDNVLVSSTGVENLTRSAFNDAGVDSPESTPAT